ncbi:hypothetical protein WUBG_11600, partial [Wuchereria bancrofti]
ETQRLSLGQVRTYVRTNDAQDECDKKTVPKMHNNWKKTFNKSIIRSIVIYKDQSVDEERWKGRRQGQTVGSFGVKGKRQNERDLSCKANMLAYDYINNASK